MNGWKFLLPDASTRIVHTQADRDGWTLDKPKT